jgi:hypothetical protein
MAWPRIKCRLPPLIHLHHKEFAAGPPEREGHGLLVQFYTLHSAKALASIKTWLEAQKAACDLLEIRVRWCNDFPM